MRNRTRQLIASATVITALLTLTAATASTSAASTDVPTDVRVLFARSLSGSTHGWDGKPEPDPDVRQVQVGFRVFKPALTLSDKRLYELPGVTARAVPATGAATGTGTLACYVAAPGDLDSLAPEFADVHCYGTVKPVGDSDEGRFVVTVPTSKGTEAFSVEWLPCFWVPGPTA